MALAVAYLLGYVYAPTGRIGDLCGESEVTRQLVGASEDEMISPHKDQKLRS